MLRALIANNKQKLALEHYKQTERYLYDVIGVRPSKEMQEIYEQLYGKKPAVMAVHAGLECGILGSKYTHWDMISFGPTICSPHSPDERVNIASVGKFWEYLKATLKNIPAK